MSEFNVKSNSSESYNIETLRIEALTKEYRPGLPVNDNISISVKAGEVYGLLGPNGAGKSTLVNQVVGLVVPTSGKISIDGVDVVANPGYARQACSFQPQSQVPIEGLTLIQAITLVGRLRGGRTETVWVRAKQLVERLELGEWAQKKGEHLSGGIRRLVAFSMAVIVADKLVILDEPTNDVDPLRRRLLWREVRHLAEKGIAVLLVTHNVLEAERSVDRLAIIDRGQVVGCGTPASLKERKNGSLRMELILEPAADGPNIPPFLSKTLRVGRRLIGKVAAYDVNQAVIWAQELVSNQVAEEYAIGPATLEDIYLGLVGRQDALDEPVREMNHGLQAQLVS